MRQYVPSDLIRIVTDMPAPQLFETEIKRRIKNPPALAAETENVQNAFPVAVAEKAEEDEDEVEVLSGDIVEELWTFGAAL
jgi:hypothetical protein